MEQTTETGVFRRKDGRLKVVTTAKCPKTGKLKKRRRVMPSGATLEDAVRVRDEIKARVRDDDEEGAPPPRITVGDYAVAWLKSKATRLKPRPLRDYQNTLAKRILPHLGDLYVDVLCRQDILEWVAEVEASEREDGRTYADATVKGWWRILCLLVRDLAADHGLPDPTTRVRPPTTHVHGRQEKRTLSARELGELLDAMQVAAPTRFAEAATLAYTGIRVGELYALRWEDLDPSRNMMVVRRALSAGVLTDTKTHAEREVYLPNVVLEALEHHREGLITQQHPGLSSGLVFPASHGGVRGTSTLAKPLGLAAEHAGITQRVTPQVLRRTFNTLMLAAGADKIVLRSQMGHSSAPMTQRYAGVRLESKAKAVERIFQLVPVDTSVDTQGVEGVHSGDMELNKKKGRTAY